MTFVRCLLAISILSTLASLSTARMVGSASATTAHGMTNFAVQITNIGWRRGDQVEVTVTFPDGSTISMNTTVAGNSGGTGIDTQKVVGGDESAYNGQSVTITADNITDPNAANVTVTATVQ